MCERKENDSIYNDVLKQLWIEYIKWIINMNCRDLFVSLSLCLSSSFRASFPPCSLFPSPIPIPWYSLLAKDLWGKFCNLSYAPHPNDHHKMTNQQKIKILHKYSWNFFLFPLKLLVSPLIGSLESICKHFSYKADMQLWLFVMVMW